MTDSDFVALLIVGGLAALLLVLAVILLSGHGGSLIAGYNTMSREEQERFDRRALCRFTGLILLPIALGLPLVVVAGIWGRLWLGAVYAAVVLLDILFAVLYMNTGNRFRK